MKKQIVFTDAFTLNPGDLDLSPLQELGEFYAFDRIDNLNIPYQVKQAEILIVNKFKINKEILDQLPELKYITVAATGYNNIEADAVREREITVSNVKDYSTDSVAQHVFSMILAWFNKSEYYSELVKNEEWSKTEDFCFFRHRIQSLNGLKLGILGYGSIGKRVGDIDRAFGMEILVHSRTSKNIDNSDVRFVTIDELLSQSDVLSLHVPLSEDTRYIINESALLKMKKSALLVNTARGPLIDENALLNALSGNVIAGACLDVLECEPPHTGNPLIHHPHCLITPHIAWAGHESRLKLLEEVVNNIKGYLSGNIINQVI